MRRPGTACRNGLKLHDGPDGALGQLHFAKSASFILPDTDDVRFDQVGDAGGIIVHVVPRPSGSEALVAECIGDAVSQYTKA